MDTAAGDPHAPKKIEDMAGAADWGRMITMLSRPEPPNVILVGPAGIGKSSALRLGLDPARIAVWLRCSQDPTLRDNRDRIKAAARRRVEAGAISWLVLEHADSLHADAQAFLRRIMETSTGSSRFVLEVRDAAAITEPLLSRCILFQAPQLLTYEIRGEIQRRCPTITVEDANKIAEESEGNVRWAVLQGLSSQSSGFVGIDRRTPTSWSELLAIMEEVHASGSSPRAYTQQVGKAWDRPGGVCPWSLLALDLSKSIA